MTEYNIILKKQPVKYLDKISGNTYVSILKALEELKVLKGDIVLIDKKENIYRKKINHYRIIFTIAEEQITVLEINSRTNIKY